MKVGPFTERVIDGVVVVVVVGSLLVAGVDLDVVVLVAEVGDHSPVARHEQGIDVAVSTLGQLSVERGQRGAVDALVRGRRATPAVGWPSGEPLGLGVVRAGAGAGGHRRAGEGGEQPGEGWLAFDTVSAAEGE